MKKVAVVLCGAGHKDGSEITEAVALIVGLSRSHISMEFFAPLSKLAESEKITRVAVKDIKSLQSKKFDALAFPGGSGAAVHLFTFAKDGANCSVLPELSTAILSFHSESKPIAAICIAPAMIAKVLGKLKVEVTLGNDIEISKEIQKMGAVHVDCPVTDYVTDRENKVITTPAYMYDAKPHEVFDGIQKLTKEFVEMA